MSTSGLYIRFLSSMCTYTHIDRHNTHTNEKKLCDMPLWDHSTMLQTSEELRSNRRKQAVCAWGWMSSAGLSLNRGPWGLRDGQAVGAADSSLLSSSVSIRRCSSRLSSRPLYWIQSWTAYNPWIYLMNLLLIWTSGDNKRRLTENPIKYAKDCKG